MSKQNLMLIVILILVALIPSTGSRFYVFLATDILIFGLFALSLNLLLGYTGLVSFGHAAYFGIGAYTCALLLKKAGTSYGIAFAATGIFGAIAALIIGFFCVRLTMIYFALLTLAFAQIVWAIVFKWNDLTNGDTGIYGIDFPQFIGSKTKFFYFTLVVAAVSIFILRRIVNSPFGRMLTTIRENPERAEFIGVNVKLFQLLAFVISGFFAGIAGGLFAVFNHSVFPDFCHWPVSAEVLIMTLLGGMYSFFGPLVGTAVFLYLRLAFSSYTEFWPIILGTILSLILFFFPGGIAGFLQDQMDKWKKSR